MLNTVNIPGHYKVTYVVNKSGVKLTRAFDSEYQMRNFIRKLRYSKKCSLVSFSF